EVDRFQILSSAVDVGSPLALTVIVQIEHGCDRIYAQAVDVELLNPEHCRREQQVAYRYLTVIEYAGAPLLMLHLERIGVLIEIRTVELDQAMSVLGEVRRNPVHDDTDSSLVALVHKIHEIMRRAITRGRGKIAGNLITPGAIERV